VCSTECVQGWASVTDTKTASEVNPSCTGNDIVLVVLSGDWSWVYKWRDHPTDSWITFKFKPFRAVAPETLAAAAAHSHNHGHPSCAADGRRFTLLTTAFASDHVCHDMKTFTRRSSSKQLSSTEPSPEKAQPPSQPASRKPRGSSQQLQAAVESKDPYSFDLGIEDDQVAARPEPGPSKVTATKGEARPQVCGLGSGTTTRRCKTPAGPTDVLALFAGQTCQQEGWQHPQHCNHYSYCSSSQARQQAAAPTS
jgi:hypothetical protein